MPPVVLFDGVCNLCNASVDFIIRRDRKGRLRFAALQSEAAKAFLGNLNIPESQPDSILFYEEGKLYARSAAVLRIAAYLGFPWILTKVILIIPAFVRDAVYDFIARNRFRWFGKKETCRMPTMEERGRFL